MNAQIRQIAVALPETALSNAELRREFPNWNVDSVAQHTGVECRYIAAPQQTALDLGQSACLKLFARNEDLHEKLDTLIFCTQCPDYILPPNSCVLHGRLKLGERVAALDISHACSGFVYALALAHAFIRARISNNVVAVTADTYSKYINRKDRSARVLFGDGAAATWVGRHETGGCIRDVSCHTAGEHFDKFIVPAGGCRLPACEKTRVEREDAAGNYRTDEDIHMEGGDILSFVASRIPPHVEEMLARNNMSCDDVDLFVFHQASKLVLDTVARRLKLEPSKVFRNLKNIGNTVSASIPIALHDALDSGAAKPGDTVLLCGFGAGLSWGSVLIDL